MSGNGRVMKQIFQEEILLLNILKSFCKNDFITVTVCILMNFLAYRPSRVAVQKAKLEHNVISSVFPFHFENKKLVELVFNGLNALCRVNLKVTVKARA